MSSRSVCAVFTNFNPYFLSLQYQVIYFAVGFIVVVFILHIFGKVSG